MVRNQTLLLMLSTQQKNQHLMWRAGFGPAASQIEQLSEIQPKELYKALQKASSKKPAYLDVADNYIKGLVMGINDEAKMEELKKGGLDGETKKRIRQQSRDGLRKLNLTWFNEMISSPAQLREKMSLFWHGHFACRDINIFHQQLLLDDIRNHALGNFGDLLKAVSKSPAMLGFLNNQQNRKGHPNENFAREVMELFTMGRGNYSEQDIKEAARAFTGWGFNLKGEFVFRQFQHDTGSKTILGKTGHFDGDDVLNLLLEQKQTARFITQKIYRFFVNEIPDPSRIDWLSGRFYQSNYKINQLMEDIFTSDWFYQEKNIGNRIKSPVELMAGIQRMLPMEIENESALLLLQRVLGQVLFYPPNVAGWPGGTNWIDSSSLMTRMRIPQLITDNDELNFKAKTDDDQNMGQEEMTKGLKTGGAKMNRPIRAHITWNTYLENFESIPRESLVTRLQSVLLQVKPAFDADLIKSYADNSGRESFLKTATIQIMSTPEYQLC